MNEIDISIIIVNYNVKDFLFQCLKSIEKAEQNLNVEVIVVDNNSTDGSANYLSPLFPRVKFIALEENLGFGKANNLGFKQAKGKYFLILNPDTILEENTLLVMKEYHDTHQEVGIAGCKVLNADGTFQVPCRRGFPTPWVAFTKLFGLQQIFPKSKLFGRYNQTFQNIDETYYIESISGSFMFARRETIEELGGFDTDFFMYAEDIDLCYRATKLNWKIAYVHTTSIIHYKGESTKRSKDNELKNFYKAMEIYTLKHYANSGFLLFFLKIGIFLRSFLAYLNKYKSIFSLILLDIITINLSLLLATKIRYDEFFRFPDHAYPTVFIVITLVMLGAMVSIGEYFEEKCSVRKSFFALMITFFVLSSLTYFFNEYAFSRGVLLMTIAITTVLTSGYRTIINSIQKIRRKEIDKRIAIIGMNNHSEKILKRLQSINAHNTNILGFIATETVLVNEFSNFPIIGHFDYLAKIIDDLKISEIIITDKSIANYDLIKTITSLKNNAVKFHIAQDYEEIVTARIINEITGIEPTVPKYNITKFRYKFVKRVVDILISFMLLIVTTPIILIFFNKSKELLKNFWKVFIGKYTLIGLLSNENGLDKELGKVGLIGLAHLGKNEYSTVMSIKRLNDYYLQNMSLSLDIDIFFKYIFRK
ncbi:MAG TPA: glycosyltransferase [Candidatus Kapabacteria bacterium]|nr:glycosyltransferase [Candidatus Kapabacteria bacterium]HPO62455.1 glycosyltransferase [Candidatus Kapabacteria bacterium]